MVKSIKKSDFDNVLKQFEAAPSGNEPLPSGNYTAKIVSGELFEAKTGTPGYKITWKVIDGEFADHLFWQDLYLSAKAMNGSKWRLVKLGITDLRNPPPAGICAELELAIKSGEETDFNEIKKIIKVWKDEKEEKPLAIEQSSMKEDEDVAIEEDAYLKSLETIGLEGTGITSRTETPKV